MNTTLLYCRDMIIHPRLKCLSSANYDVAKHLLLFLLNSPPGESILAYKTTHAVKELNRLAGIEES